MSPTTVVPSYTQPGRRIEWTDNCCEHCERNAFERRDGRSYLYVYPDICGWAVVCSPRCARAKAATAVGNARGEA